MIKLVEIEKANNDNLSVYDSDSFDSYSFEKDGKSYVLDLNSNYDISSGDSFESKTIYLKKENEKLETIYEYWEKSTIEEFEETCFQNVLEIDEDILKDSALKLPTEKEILVKNLTDNIYVEENVEKQKNHYFNQFKEIFEDLVEEKNLQNKLPPFQILTDNGMALDENKNISDDLKQLILEVKGEEFWNNLDINDVRSFEELSNSGLVKILVADNEKDNNDEYNFKEYTNYQEYISPTVKEELSKELVEKYDKGELESFEKELKDLVLKNRDEFSKKSSKEINENEVEVEKNLSFEKEF